MAIGLEQFTPETFAQANPFLTGFDAAQNSYQNAIRSQYAQPMAQQALMKAQYGNQILSPLAQNAPALVHQELLNAIANVANTKAHTAQIYQGQIPLNQAQAYQARGAGASQFATAGLTNEQANILGQQAPYMVQGAQENLFKDPILARMYQMGLAQKTGAINPSLLGQLGMQNSPQGAASAPVGNLPNGNTPVSPLMPNAANGGVSPQVASAPKMFGGSPMQNWAIFGSPLNPLQMMQLKALGQGMNTNATSSVTNYNDALGKAASEGSLATQLSNLVSQFKNNYAQTSETGAGLGRLPAVSSAAQLTDNASNNLAALYAKQITGGRVTNYEAQYVNSLKPTRSMNSQAAQTSSDFWQQKALRMQEEQPFLNTAKANGVDLQTAQTLWNQYNNQRPVYNFQQHQPNTQFQKTWSAYLTPQAVYAAQNGLNFVPLPKFNSAGDFKAWMTTLPPSDRQTVMSELKQQQKQAGK